MFNKDRLNLSKAAEAEQLRLFSELEGLDPDSKEFATRVEHINNIDNVKIKKTSVSKDAVISAAASTLGLLLVLNFERTGAIVSKAFGLVRKP